MTWFARRKCRKGGHVVHPDPGDFVLYCTRCHAMADLHEIAAAMERNRSDQA